MNPFSMSVFLWFRLIFGLKKRGGGERESGGFLLSKPGKRKVVRIVFYDQFDKTVSDSGIIQFKGASSFFEFLEKEKLEVLADIHTHPTRSTQQSDSDRKHPMIRLKGHIAIIAPNYAGKSFLLPEECSFYEYQGGFDWRKFDKLQFPIRLKLI